MTVDANQFVTDFPEFSNPADYPVASINFYLALSTKLLAPNRWCDLLDFGTELFVAHNIALESQNAAAAALGGSPGIVTGPTSAKGVDKVSVSYDTTAAMEDKAGHWALTTYGLRYLNLARMVGMGGVQL